MLVHAGWGSRQVLLDNQAMNDGHGPLGGRRFQPKLCEPNEVDHPWHTWIILRRR